MNEYRNLSDFLRKHKTTERANITHTRIGNGKDVLPGKYHIPAEEMAVFNKLYHKHVFVDKKKEYLTEVQLKGGNTQMMVDLDFRYSPEVRVRQHCQEHVEDIIQVYVESIGKFLDYKDRIKIPIYVMEKPSVNTTKETVTKDGLHMVFSMCIDHTTQAMIRDEVLANIADVFDDLDLTNDYKDVLDEGITKGTTNWQLYGSRKPDNEAYEVTYKFMAEMDSDGGITLVEDDISSLNQFDTLVQVSARTPYDIAFGVREEHKAEYDERRENSKRKTRVVKRKAAVKFTQEGFNFDVSDIKNEDVLRQIVEGMLQNLNVEDYHVRETHNYLMCLTADYYDDYNKWIRCGWSLHNTDFRMFLSWMLFSSQSDKFNYADIPGYYDIWQHEMKDDGYTQRSIMYWAKQANPEGFEKVRMETLDYYIMLCKDGCNEWDIANVLYHLFKDEYRCADVKNKIWYQYKNNRWVENSTGTALRYSISKKLSRIFSDKANLYINDTINKGDAIKQEEGGEKFERMRELGNHFTKIGGKLKQTGFKQNLMREAADAFYRADPTFLQTLDTNPYLLCFINGVVDLEKKIFRPGDPEDNVSLCTNIKYVPYDKLTPRQKKYEEEIDEFMRQLYPNESLNKYMWEHLASVLVGKNINQTFNIYNGSGSNGKSKLVELMSMILGDYKGVVNSTLVTEKRQKIGGLSPEIAKLKGIRYAVMNEPSKGDRLNDGVMKELTGEDPITGRALHREPITFIPQFSLVVCTNNLFDIKSNDDGTWRRIRLCEFESKFTKNPQPDEEHPYQFMIDPNIGTKFNHWKEVFMSKLVHTFFQTDGLAKDCDMVMAASNEYRKGQDYLMEFKLERIEKTGDVTARIRKTEVYAEFKAWYTETYGKAIPKGKELYDFLDKKLGKYKRGGWWGHKIKYDMDDEPELEINDDY